ncbi:MAG: SDR family NAD(P)-dependent oxidoreductase [Armatimonadetes bacterium]|nr:SDR family NAD(P)-dependent oxidoreductase [Armatimonadota bacterium]MDW8122468.1 SDR family NAD(P)-dependent oxidoreductase [Armatimonadota bacterium]
MDLSGKVALVTGGARRLGRAIAEDLSQQGVAIAVHYRQSQKEAEEFAKVLTEKGVRSLTVKADLTLEDQVQAMMERTAQEMGRLDILINSAAIFFRTPWSELNGQVFRQFLDANLTGTFLCCRYAAPYLKESGEGVIVNITDTAGFKPWTEFLPYCVSKGAVITLTLGLARILAPEVRVNAVALGTVLPPEEMDQEEWVTKMKGRTLLGRIGSPQDAVSAVRFCIENSYLTGAIIPVDGGRWLR